jgi:hypothetical protein
VEGKLPTGVILVPGAWSSASDSTTPLPEAGSVANNIYTNAYFGLTYALPEGWTQKFYGPPPSESGYYVLAQITPADTRKRSASASLLIAAQDLFFTPVPAANVLELIRDIKNRLQPGFAVERPLTQVSVAKRSFARFDYYSPAAELHWHVLATQIRCHAVQFVFTGRDTKLIESFIRKMGEMKLPPEAGAISGTGGHEVPVCIRDYARDDNIVERVDPVSTEHRFNAIPVRIVIDRVGRVSHIHFLSAFPDQAKAIANALSQWRFNPYVRDGKPMEVETGLMFGYAPQAALP